jgi:glycosyltransferase involved in cell wall biosynthesis
MPDNISVSVVMTNYNHARYLGEALESIVSQSRLPFELVLIDDCSTDNSVEIIQQFQRRCPIIKLYRNSENLGVEKNVARLVELAQGTFVAGISADDKLLPGFFEKSVDILSLHPDAGLCCSDPVYFNNSGNGRVIGMSWLEQPGFMSPATLAGKIDGGFIYGHTCLYNREKLIQCGGYNPDLKWHCDWFTYLTMAFRHGICYVPEPLSAMRESDSAYSSSGRRDWRQQKQVIHHILKLIKSPLYRDVFPHFVNGCIMSHFGRESLDAVLECPELWDLDTKMLIQRQLDQWFQNPAALSKADYFYMYYLTGLLSYQAGAWQDANSILLQALPYADGTDSAQYSDLLWKLKETKLLMHA